MIAVEPSSLALFWAGVIAVAILVYVILDGFDLGVGILFGTTDDEALRDEMMATISPFWDGNETWLVVIGASLFAAFPDRLCGVPAGVLHPGAAAAVRADLPRRRVRVPRPRRARAVGPGASVVGSAVAAFVQGAAVGAMIRGIPVVERPICRRRIRMAGAAAGAVRDRPRARLCVARRRLAGAQMRGRAARVGAGGAFPGSRRACWSCWPWRSSRRLSERERIATDLADRQLGPGVSRSSGCWRWPASSSACAGVATACRSP